MRPSVRRLAHVLDGAQVELGEDPPGGLRADALDPHQRHGAGRVCASSLSSAEISPVSEQLGHLVGDRCADARPAGQAPGRDRPATDSGVSRSVCAARR